MDLAPALEAATRAAREAGDLLRADFHRPGGPRGGGDKAEADVEAEDVIRGRLRDAFPDWSYLGEETGRVNGRPGAPIWLVDPNDGTRDYLVGRRGSAVSIGLAHEGRAVLGVVFAFAYPDDRGDLFVWAEGQGPLRRNGVAIETVLPEVLGPTEVVLVSSKGDRDPEGNLRGAEPARYRAVASIAHRLALVAAGEASAAVSLFSPGAWDYAAGHALVRAAGGVLVDEAGREVVYAMDGSSQCVRAFAGAPSVAHRLARQPWEAVGVKALAAPSARPGLGAGPVPGEAVADPGLLSRAQGCLLAQIAGNSLGSLVPLATAEEVARRYPDGPRLLTDGEAQGTLAGQPTDDTEMALALSRSILATGHYEADAALASYREWQASEPLDIGNAMRAALAGRAHPASQANGSLPRASPLGLFAHASPVHEAARLARTDSTLTHSNPVCGEAVAACVVAIRHAVAHGDGPEAAYRAALDWATSEGAALSVVQALRQAQEGPPVCDGPSPRFVLIALRNAFHELLHAQSLEAGVVATVRRGGDTDTNAAVAGALLGAVHGRDAVPAEWRRMVLSCRPHPSRVTRARPVAFWPVDVLEIAERLLLRGARAGR